ncbi:hypothetical protein [Demequina iriomotensis]|uniref:hypothetical protein n=1 Tax=Demequina iriomotensis TaxID=1536641 RepID=UPI0007804BB9|nr:hypothetical protein [Demequina iriomotensis]
MAVISGMRVRRGAAGMSESYGSLPDMILRPRASTVIAGVALTALLAGCSTAVTPVDSSPAASAAAIHAEAAATASPEVTSEVVVSEVVEPVAAGEWPAEGDGYVFSEEPQGGAERWLFDNYPGYWDLGVRAVTTTNTMSWYGDDDSQAPSFLVRFIDGVRFVGTEEAPLGLTRADDVLGRVTLDGTESKERIADVFQGKYSVRLKPSGGDGELLRIEIFRYGGEDSSEVYYNGEPYPAYHTYSSIDEAWRDIRDGIPLGGGRILDPAEMTRVFVLDESYQATDLDLQSGELFARYE